MQPSAKPDVSQGISRQPKIYYPPTNRDDFIPGRPGCVTTYLVVMLAITVLVLASAFWPERGQTLWESLAFVYNRPDLWIGSLIIVGFNAVNVVACIGLWFMKDWARVIHLLILVIMACVTIGLIVYSLALSPNLLSGVICTYLPIITCIYLSTRWFINNRRRFN